jgi:hypothetical protein
MASLSEHVSLTSLSVAEAGRKIAAREISPVDLVEALLGRISVMDERLHSYITLLAEPARLAARNAEAEIAAGRWRGPLHGIPYIPIPLEPAQLLCRALPSRRWAHVERDAQQVVA